MKAQFLRLTENVFVNGTKVQSVTLDTTNIIVYSDLQETVVLSGNSRVITTERYDFVSNRLLAGNGESREVCRD